MEMTEEDQPPEEIWLDGERLAAHFEAVREKYQSRASGSEVAQEDMTENEAVKGLRR